MSDNSTDTINMLTVVARSRLIVIINSLTGGDKSIPT